MFSPLRLTGSCFALKTIGVALVAGSLASCGADVTRSDNRSYRGVAHSPHPNAPSGSSVTRTASGLDPFFVVRPKADVPIVESSHSNSTAGSPSPKNTADHLSKGHRELKVASKEGHPASRKKEKPKGEHQVVDAEPRATQTLAKTQEPQPVRPFQWPLNGKVVASFGARSNGLKNEGITIEVPEDTSIKGAEDGEVIYAGNGLKGYGNLVLVRHANDYVSVYAHANEISVKRGDQIKRGDVIGSSGQTGNVSTPQLYFEIRKGTMPVDPIPLMATRSSQTKQGRG
jgi:murein DD-endopeptidase MepM/ murein hydrolase activator NlpD